MSEEGLVGTSPAEPSFGITPTLGSSRPPGSSQICGRAGASQAFFWYAKSSQSQKVFIRVCRLIIRLQIIQYFRVTDAPWAHYTLYLSWQCTQHPMHPSNKKLRTCFLRDVAHTHPRKLNVITMYRIQSCFKFMLGCCSTLSSYYVHIKFKMEESDDIEHTLP